MIDAKRLNEIRERLDLLAVTGGAAILDQLLKQDIPDMLNELERKNDKDDPPTVMLESPYAGDVESNEDYARRCVLDSLRRGEAPMAGHLLYTQVLKDANPTERELGIRAHLAWLRRSRGVVVYTDRDVSPGMRRAVELSMSLRIPVTQRKLKGYGS